MKLSLTPARLAVLFPCIALMGAARAQDAANPAVPPAPNPKADKPAQKPLEIPDPVATVNGEAITKAKLQEAFDGAVKMAGVDPSTLSNEEKLAGYNKLLDDLVMDTLLKDAAKGIEVSDEDVDKEVEQIKQSFPDEKQFDAKLSELGQTPEKLRGLIKDGLKQRKWIEGQVGDAAKVTEADAKKFYDENPDEFKHPEQVSASHILITVPEGASDEDVKKKESEAKAALEQAKATKTDEEFAELAKKLSQEPGAAERGGALGYFSKDMMVPEFANAAFSTKVGEITGPVKTQFGYHIIKVTGHKDAGTVPFDEVKGQLEGYLGQQKQQEAVTNVIDKLRSGAKIEKELPAPAAPAAPTAPMPEVDTGSGSAN